MFERDYYLVIVFESIQQVQYPIFKTCEKRGGSYYEILDMGQYQLSKKGVSEIPIDADGFFKIDKDWQHRVFRR